ncbi:MAG: response regulator [Sulfurimonadaceae bacterium]|nr:response regulator [Sulfurimonadaceae bacterium]
MNQMKKTILVLDDEPVQLSLIAKVLSEGYMLKLFSLPEEMLQYCHSKSGRADLILLDIIMPGMDGYSVLEELKKIDYAVPVIFMSSQTESEVQARGLELGAVDYITKPVNPMILKARIKTHIALNERNRELKREQERLEASEKKLEIALDSANVGIWEYDIDTGELIWDDRMCLLYDTPRDAFTHDFNAWSSRLHPEDKKWLVQLTDDVLAGNSEYDPEFRIVLSDGKIRHIKGYAEVIRDSDGTPLQMIGTNWDITERVEQEGILLQQSKMAAMGEMVGAIAHQWRQPLNVVGLLTQEIEWRFANDILTSETLHESVDKVLDTIEYMSQTIDDFRNFLKPSDTVGVFHTIDAIEEALNITGKQLESHGIDVSITSECLDSCNAETAYTVNGNIGEFKQVIINLINNAREAIDANEDDENKKITINVVRSCDEVSIEMRDTGCGIAEEVVETLFDPYVSTKYAQQGTGIGLYMSKMIIERNMKGTLSSKNTDDGAAFTVVLPVGQA